MFVWPTRNRRRFVHATAAASRAEGKWPAAWEAEQGGKRGGMQGEGSRQSVLSDAFELALVGLGRLVKLRQLEEALLLRPRLLAIT